jgi:hypothetical protein
MFVVVLESPLVAGTGRIKTVAVLDGMKSDAVSTGWRSSRFVLVAVTRRERFRSRLVGARSFSMQVGRSVLTLLLSK